MNRPGRARGFPETPRIIPQSRAASSGMRMGASTPSPSRAVRGRGATIPREFQLPALFLLCERGRGGEVAPTSIGLYTFQKRKWRLTASVLLRRRLDPSFQPLAADVGRRCAPTNALGKGRHCALAPRSHSRSTGRQRAAHHHGYRCEGLDAPVVPLSRDARHSLCCRRDTRASHYQMRVRHRTHA
jgi:hypothetical protein